MLNNCPSNLRGATYATSEVVVQHDKMISWDRGFDSRDKQVWGAEKGGYIFMKELK
jgi:CpeT protein